MYPHWVCIHLICVDLGFISQWTEDSCSNTCRVSGTPTRGRSLVEKTWRYATWVCASTKGFGYDKPFLDHFFERTTNLSLFTGSSSLAHIDILESLLPLQFSLRVIWYIFWLSHLPFGLKVFKSHLLWGLFSIFPLHSVLCMLRSTITALLRLLSKDQVKLTNRWYLAHSWCPCGVWISGR